VTNLFDKKLYIESLVGLVARSVLIF